MASDLERVRMILRVAFHQDHDRALISNHMGRGQDDAVTIHFEP